MNTLSPKTVVIGMSGGVDSSVSALLLKQQGYNCIAIFMKNWDEKDEHGNCTAGKEYADVIKVCEKLDIPYYSIEFIKEYQEEVFSYFLKEYRAGNTPNPDILCNRYIKFKHFYQKALELGADYLATGHYCQTGIENGLVVLKKGIDPEKDQSYFLHAIDGTVLPNVLFPIGGLLKSEVRKIAKEHGIPTMDKKDSTGICFIGERNFRNFLSHYIESSCGDFRTLDGKKVGEHQGSCFYTIGQRKGLGLGGEGWPWFVIKKDVATNVVYVERGEHPELYKRSLVADDICWINSSFEIKIPFRCKAKIRYRQADQDCTITKIETGKIFVEFDSLQRGIAPRQSVVFYLGDVCLGGASILIEPTAN